MPNYLPSHYKLSKEITNQLLSQGYSPEEIRRKWTPWKIRMIEFGKRKDVRGQLGDNETWDSRFYREMTTEEPEGTETSKKKRRRVYNQAADPELNKELEKQLDEILAIDNPNSKARLKELREKLKL